MPKHCQLNLFYDNDLMEWDDIIEEHKPMLKVFCGDPLL